MDIVNFDVEVDIQPQYNIDVDGDNDVDLNADDGNELSFDCKDGTIYIRRETYIYHQTTASNMWVIEHELDRFPSVTVIDSAGTKVTGDVKYMSNRLIILTFAAAFSGTAYLN